MTAALSKAIKLREWTRRALDTHPGVDRTLIELNRRADAAYMELTPAESRAYRDWAFRGVDVEAMFRDLFGEPSVTP